MVTTAWLDLEDLLRKRSIVTMTSNQEQLEPAVILGLLNKTGPRKSAVGACLRWAVASYPAGKLQLQLQSLPIPASFLSPAMTVNNTVSVLIHSLPLVAEYFDGSALACLVPAFFSADPPAARASLAADIPATRNMIAALSR